MQRCPGTVQWDIPWGNCRTFYFSKVITIQSLIIFQRHVPGDFCMKVGLCSVLGIITITNTKNRHVDWYTPTHPTQLQIQTFELPTCQKMKIILHKNFLKTFLLICLKAIKISVPLPYYTSQCALYRLRSFKVHCNFGVSRF